MKTIIYKFLISILCSFWLQNLQAQDPNWTVNTSNYQYSMTFTTFLNVEGKTLTSENDKVGAFVNGTIRGVANVIYVASVNKYVAYLSVYANTNNETINFKIYDSSTDLVVNIDKNEAFAIDGNIGGIFQSYSIANPALNDGAIFTSFNFSGITALITAISSNKINIVLAKNSNLSSLLPVYNSSIHSKVFVDDMLQESGSSTQDFTKPIIYKVVSENEAVFIEYEVSVTSAVNEDPTTVTISNAENLDTNSVPIPIEINFSNNVSGFEAADFSIENAIISSFTKIDSKNYKAEITPLSQGVLSIQVSVNSTIDEDNNQNELSNKLEFTYDIIKPIISDIYTDSDANSWWFIVDFNEEVLNVDKTDFDSTGAAANSLDISTVGSISSSKYRINIENSNSEIGTISLKLNSKSDIVDKNGNEVILSEFEAYFLNNVVLNIKDITYDDAIKIYTSQKNNLRIEGLKLSKENTSIKIYNLLGVEILQKDFETKIVNNIKLPNLKTGVYIIHLKNSSGEINKKIIIE